MKTELLKKSILIGFVFISFACVTKPFYALLDSPCSPPCWQNITPGETTHNETIQIIENLSGINWQISGSLGAYRKPFTDIYSIKYCDDQVVDIYFIDGLVFSIVISENLQISAEKAIDLFGEPESLYIHRFEAGSIYFMHYSLLYPRQGLLLTFQDNPPSSGFVNIAPKDSLSAIFYLEPEKFIDSLKEFYIFNDPLANFEFLPWQGYGDIEFPLE